MMTLMGVIKYVHNDGFVIQPESDGATVEEGVVVSAQVGNSELLLCHRATSIVRMMRVLLMPLSKVRFI